jgi:SulP family sulfate permease
MVNMRSGAKTGFASIVTGFFILFTLLYLTPYLYYMPMVILSAIILVAVMDLIKIKPLLRAFKIQKHD